MKRRLFHIPDLMAEQYRSRYALPWVPHALEYQEEVVPQASLPLHSRLKRRQDCYKARRLVANQRILLVDDVITSGATVSSAALSLLDQGAYSVEVAAIARGKRFPLCRARLHDRYGSGCRVQGEPGPGTHSSRLPEPTARIT